MFIFVALCVKMFTHDLIKSKVCRKSQSKSSFANESNIFSFVHLVGKKGSRKLLCLPVNAALCWLALTGHLICRDSGRPKKTKWIKCLQRGLGNENKFKKLYKNRRKTANTDKNILNNYFCAYQGLLYHRMCKPDFQCSWPSLNSYLK